MAKRKCKGCGERKDRDIKTAVTVGPMFFCANDCRIEYGIKSAKKLAEKAKEKREKAERKVNAEKKRKFYANDIKTRKAAAKKACHDYIKARDRGQPCICCGKPMDVAVNAGHFLESGNHPFIRYDEDNIHAQRVDCNMYKGGDSGSYKENLIAKIGIERVQKLFDNKDRNIKRTAEDYKAIEDYYKQKLKELNNQTV